jgi:hypothetical protein
MFFGSYFALLRGGQMHIQCAMDFSAVSDVGLHLTLAYCLWYCSSPYVRALSLYHEIHAVGVFCIGDLFHCGTTHMIARLEPDVARLELLRESKLCEPENMHVKMTTLSVCSCDLCA